MPVIKTDFAGLYMYVPDPISDDRGWFNSLNHDSILNKDFPSSKDAITTHFASQEFELHREKTSGDHWDSGKGDYTAVWAGPKRFVQTNLSYNFKRGTIRGLHFQDEPHPQGKLVRCVRGAIHDVAVDIRPLSPTFKQYFGAYLTEHNRESVYVPAGFAHGYVTLDDDTEVEYQVTDTWHPECEGGFRWDDKAFNIAWMTDAVVVSEKDFNWPNFNL